MKMSNVTTEHMRKFCESCNCKLYSFEPKKGSLQEYIVLVDAGVFGTLPKFSVTSTSFKGIGDYHNFNLSEKWVKFLDEIKTNKTEECFGL